MQIPRVLIMMVPHASTMSMFLITTLAIVFISTVIAKPSFSTSKSSFHYVDSSYTEKSKGFLPKLYGDYGFWNPSPIYGGGFPYPGPVPHGRLSPQERHKKPN
ncbi:unnamed protein product [Thlaspi arvense]|uniref:Transmembrane protein n=1 Tax=Thlaspi arvense TaxID=13288 RepID=A0AAU9RA89_THLAR|nr:unnamed protein product [Thlaspi arvense]